MFLILFIVGIAVTWACYSINTMLGFVVGGITLVGIMSYAYNQREKESYEKGFKDGQQKNNDGRSEDQAA